MATSVRAEMISASIKIVELNWDQEEIDEPREVTGSVVEFAFGPDDNSYFATSYPYRAEYADKDKDKRKVAKQNLPREVLHQIADLHPRYIMNLAFRTGSKVRSSGKLVTPWFIFFYGTRTAYDAKWFPNKPPPEDSIGQVLSTWRGSSRDQVSSCAFGEDPETFFIRSTDPDTKWFPYLRSSLGALNVEFLDAKDRRDPDKRRKNKQPMDHTKLRAITFGQGNTYIMYSIDDFSWSRTGLPNTLLNALDYGHQQDEDSGKKAVLNPRNRREYVLVYDHGPVYCSFDPDFEDSFKEILQEWVDAKLDCKKHHKPPGLEWEYRFNFERPEDAIIDQDNLNDSPESLYHASLSRPGSIRHHRDSASTVPRIVSESTLSRASEANSPPTSTHSQPVESRSSQKRDSTLVAAEDSTEKQINEERIKKLEDDVSLVLRQLLNRPSPQEMPIFSHQPYYLPPFDQRSNERVPGSTAAPSDRAYTPVPRPVQYISGWPQAYPSIQYYSQTPPGRRDGYEGQEPRYTEKELQRAVQKELERQKNAERRKQDARRDVSDGEGKDE